MLGSKRNAKETMFNWKKCRKCKEERVLPGSLNSNKVHIPDNTCEVVSTFK